MGPKNQWQGAPWKHKDKSGGSDSSNSWSYWSGAWKAKGQDWRRNQSTDGTLVGYSNMEVPTVGHSTVSIPAATVQGLHAGDAVDGDFLKLVQKHLNSNRRLEGRLRKLQEDAQKKQAQWKAFESHMRDFFLQEKVKFQKDLEGITRETGDLEQQKRQALQALLHVLDNKHPQDMETEPTGAMRPADLGDWDEFVSEASAPVQQAGAGRCGSRSRSHAACRTGPQRFCSYAEVSGGQSGECTTGTTTTAMPLPASMPTCPGQALAPFRQAQLLSACGDPPPLSVAPPSTHVIGRPTSACSRDRYAQASRCSAYVCQAGWQEWAPQVAARPRRYRQAAAPCREKDAATLSGGQRCRNRWRLAPSTGGREQCRCSGVLSDFGRPGPCCAHAPKPGVWQDGVICDSCPRAGGGVGRCASVPELTGLSSGLPGPPAPHVGHTCRVSMYFPPLPIPFFHPPTSAAEEVSFVSRSSRFCFTCWMLAVSVDLRFTPFSYAFPCRCYDSVRGLVRPRHVLSSLLRTQWGCCAFALCRRQVGSPTRAHLCSLRLL